MALNQAQVNKLYNEMLGRNATFGDASDYDADYWVGKTADQVKRGISGSSEFKNRAALTAGDAGISEADLDKMVLPGGWKTEHHTGYDSNAGDLFDFNRANSWKESIESGGGNWTTNQNAINNVLGATAANNYSTSVPGVKGSGVTDGSKLPVDTDTGTGSNYLTSDDLTSWWDKLDKPWLNQNNTSGGMDDFMKLMMFMSMMRPQAGGYGGGQYGYGGLNPGGVQSAYNPMDNISGMMDAFKTLPGISTSTINATGS